MVRCMEAAHLSGRLDEHGHPQHLSSEVCTFIRDVAAAFTNCMATLLRSDAVPCLVDEDGMVPEDWLALLDSLEAKVLEAFRVPRSADAPFYRLGGLETYYVKLVQRMKECRPSPSEALVIKGAGALSRVDLVRLTWVLTRVDLGQRQGRTEPPSRVALAWSPGAGFNFF